MAAVKSRDKKLTQRRGSLPGVRERATITLWKKLELRRLQVRAKFPHDGAKRG
jgi:hypothetical protein